MEPQAIAPPDLEVRREILRLELEAEIADKQAEADSILADAAVEGRPLPVLEPVGRTTPTTRQPRMCSPHRMATCRTRTRHPS